MNEGESLMTVRNQSALPLFISFQDKITCPCLSKICPCLFSNEKYRTNNIKDKDLKAYYQLKALVSLEYNQFDSSHEESLKSLYLKTINNNFTNNLTSAEWEKIGFNSWNPREDFKEGGYYALLFITHFVFQNETEFDEICALKHFRFALVAIKITFYFKLALDLMEDSKICQDLRQENNIKVVTVPQFKAFLFNHSRDENNYIFELLSRIIIVIRDNYLTQRKNDENVINENYINNLTKKTFDRLFYPELDREYSRVSLSQDKSFDDDFNDN